MSRRLTFILFFLAIAVSVSWYAASSIDIPEYSFQQAAGVGDAKKKVIVTGTVAAKDITPDGGTLTFYLIDKDGEESKVYYDGQDPVPAEKIAAAQKRGEKLSVAGHMDAEYFHTSGITFH
jgi:hypothetical protein